jgi:hypothetical protein
MEETALQVQTQHILETARFSRDGHSHLEGECRNVRQGHDTALEYRFVQTPLMALCTLTLVCLGSVLPFDRDASTGHEGVWYGQRWLSLLHFQPQYFLFEAL